MRHTYSSASFYHPNTGKVCLLGTCDGCAAAGQVSYLICRSHGHFPPNALNVVFEVPAWPTRQPRLSSTVHLHEIEAVTFPARATRSMNPIAAQQTSGQRQAWLHGSSNQAARVRRYLSVLQSAEKGQALPHFLAHLVRYESEIKIRNDKAAKLHRSQNLQSQCEELDSWWPWKTHASDKSFIC